MNLPLRSGPVLRFPCVLAAALGSLAAQAPDADDWPAWRGPRGDGVGRADLPDRFDAPEAWRWRVPVPGRGLSTPIVLGERVFLTTAVAVPDSSADEVSDPSTPRDEPSGHADGRELAFEVHCLDRLTGATRWRRVAARSVPREGHHVQYGSHASGSPVTDGRVLFATFGSHGVYAYDLEGLLLWRYRPGFEVRMRRQYGEGASPGLDADTLYLNFDQEGRSWLIALDQRTGRERWRVERDEPSTWATPLATTHDGVAQVVTSGTTAVRCYAAADGTLLWQCAGLGLNAIPIPVRVDDLVLVTTGYRHANLMALRLGGRGDLTGSDRVVWSTVRGTPYTCSPVLVDSVLLTVLDRGFLSAFDARTGHEHFALERLPRGHDFKASPVVANGKLYLASENGGVLVLALGPPRALLAENLFDGESFLASPAIAHGDLFLRGTRHVICVRGR